jgi:hypothetical protein
MFKIIHKKCFKFYVMYKEKRKCKLHFCFHLLRADLCNVPVFLHVKILQFHMCYVRNHRVFPFFPLLRIRPIGLFQFRIISEIMNHRHAVGLLGRVISSLQGLYLHKTTQHGQTRTTYMPWAGFEPAIQCTSAHGPHLRPRGHRIGRYFHSK